MEYGQIFHCVAQLKYWSDDFAKKKSKYCYNFVKSLWTRLFRMWHFVPNSKCFLSAHKESKRFQMLVPKHINPPIAGLLRKTAHDK